MPSPGSLPNWRTCNPAASAYRLGMLRYGPSPVLKHIASLASSMPAPACSWLALRGGRVRTALQTQLLLAGGRGLGWEVPISARG